MKLLLPLLLAVFVVLGVSFAQVEAQKASRPNIIVILADDMGFSDIGCYGSEVPTPNLDALAADGLKFTNFHNMSRCCPSRATLLTGLYSHEAGVGHMTEIDKSPLPSYEGYLNKQCVTEAEVLNPAGYMTLMVGKWHVGQEQGVTPSNRGFQESLNSIAGGFYRSDARNAKLFLNGQDIGNGKGTIPLPWYSTDLWTTYGLKFIDDALAAKKPFYLYLAYNAPHYPLQAPPEEIAKFRHGIYEQGWDKLREARYQRQLQMGVIDKSWGLSKRDPQVRAWDSLTPEQKDVYDATMATYAAVISHLDTQIGVLVAGLKQRGLFDNTVIIFLSDNGANAEGQDGKAYPDMDQGHAPVKLGRSWANLGNTPFRMFKHYEHEGGISTPFIVHWPEGISGKGELRNQLGDMIDIMPTVVDLAGATYPTEFNGHAILPEEGVSIVPAFNSTQPLAARTQPLFWEHEGNRAINDGHWKLVALWQQPWELYDFNANRTELTRFDLAAEHPDLVKQLSAEWEAWGKRVGVAEETPGAPVFGARTGKAPKKSPEEAPDM
jgi:arylsulfatase